MVIVLGEKGDIIKVLNMDDVGMVKRCEIRTQEGLGHRWAAFPAEEEGGLGMSDVGGLCRTKNGWRCRVCRSR